MSLSYRIDPVSRYVHFSYSAPSEAPDRMVVLCQFSPDQGATWQRAAVWRHVSDTALGLIPRDEWEEGILCGRLRERRAAGLRRSLVWNPFAAVPGQARVRFRLTLQDQGEELESQELDISLDNDDVVVLDDWGDPVQKHLVSEDPMSGQAVWWVRRGQEGEGNSLEVKEKGVELPPLTYPLDLRGMYALFVQVPPALGCVELRLTGDERAELFHSGRAGQEVLWRWADMTRQHLVVGQPFRTVHEYEEGFRARLDRVRLVPLDDEQVEELEAHWQAAEDRRTVVGYSEPYSWAFYEKVERTLQHREPLLAFAQARVDAVDIQIGRGGCRMVCETRVGSQLLAGTMGDPVRGQVPRTDSVGRMQQYTNTLDAQLRYARELGLEPAANLGATNCYVGTPLESEFSQAHPEWREGSMLRYEVPEVRQFVLALFEEALQVGADNLSVDWCRYPNSVHSSETTTGFFRELRGLADRYGVERSLHVDILTRFPARGVPGWEHMDFATWVREGLVDCLCPSNIQGRHLHFDLAEYLEAVAGTRTRLLPCVDALDWGLIEIRGMWLARILDCYEQGADGVYIYQCDAPVLAGPQSRRWVSIAGSVAALRRWREREEAEQEYYSKGIYINPPHRDGQYQRWGRLRVWVEGCRPEAVELDLDGERINQYQAPPYILTSESREDDQAVAPGRHLLRVRARDGEGWLEQDFEVEFA